MNKTQRKRILRMHQDGVSDETCVGAITQIVLKKYLWHGEMYNRSAQPVDITILTSVTDYHAELVKEIALFYDRTADGRTCAAKN